MDKVPRFSTIHQLASLACIIPTNGSSSDRTSEAELRLECSGGNLLNMLAQSIFLLQRLIVSFRIVCKKMEIPVVSSNFPSHQQI